MSENLDSPVQLPEEAMAFMENGKNARFFAVPVKSMTREQLYAMIGWVIHEAEEENKAALAFSALTRL